jgi:hypothetical protein
LLISNVDSLAFNAASHALQDLSGALCDMARVTWRLQHAVL